MRDVIELVPVTELEPAAYNPREADPQRLRLLTVSLTKLGFILPLYATASGHLLSGHQRLSVAISLGATHVPVVRMKVDPKQVRNVNLVFNRATNDMTRQDTSDTLWGSLAMSELAELLERVPDKMPNTPEFYRCMQAVETPLASLFENLCHYESASVEMCVKLIRRGVIMPVVRREDGEIVNGQYRVMAAGEAEGRWQMVGSTYPVVTISNDEGEIARRLLNMISMKFTVEDQYADQLRYGSYRRPQISIPDVSMALRVFADNGRARPAHAAMKDAKRYWGRFRKVHGESLLDFGAGQRRSEDMLRAKGFDCVSWEPYPCDWRGEAEPDEENGGGKPSLALARDLTDNLLDAVASGKQFSAINANAVLNSVPFHFDRSCALATIHALCGIGTGFVGSVRSVRTLERQLTSDMNRVNNHNQGRIGVAMSIFSLDYEPNVALGDINHMPKVQKFHTAGEISALLKLFWEKVEIVDGATYLFFRATAPKRRSLPLLKTALLHEFELPYPDGKTLERGEAALAAFGKRLGVDFSKVEAAPRPGAKT